MIMGKSSCEYYRHVQPAAMVREELLKENIEIDSSFIGAQNHDLDSYDAYIFGRIPPPEIYPVIYTYKLQGKKLILDLDDELWNIPDSNPAKKHYTNWMIAYLPLYAMLCNCVTVSTRNLKDSFVKNFKYPKEKVFILENLMNSKDYDKYINKNKDHSDTPIKIVWSGSTSHAGDMQPLFNLFDYYQDRKDILFVVYGYLPPEFNAVHPNRMIHIPSSNKKDYEGILTSLSAHVALIPLDGNEFNRCKSSIKYYEMSLAGIPSIASNVQPYSDVITDCKDGFLASSDLYWQSACDTLIEDRENWEKITENAIQNVLDNYSWDTDNLFRRDWIEFFKSIPDMK